METNVFDLFRVYLEQQKDFGYPDPILSAPATGVGASVRDLESIRMEIGECDRCGLHERRTNLVFGEGNPDADILFVGEAPGADEDRIGRPFVGRSGQLLDKILAAVDLRREDVYIANVIKCRPPGNRDPEAEEIVSCIPFLRQQIESIRPKILCALGRFAAQTLLDRKDPLGRLRGRWHEWNGIRMICTYHPSACLRNQQYKRPVWEDFQMLRDEYRKIRSL